MEKFFITTPIYYVNAKPHLGHAYSTVVADALARFHKLTGKDVLFLTGTDEHGDKIVKSAEKVSQDPQVFVNNISKIFQSLWPQLYVKHDFFVRTTDDSHKKYVQSILQKVYDEGDIYFGEFGGHYCYGCERFYTEKELENGLCPQHLTTPEFICEKNYFFRMSKYLPWLLDYINNNPDFIRPDRYRQEVLAMLEQGVLEDLCISRPKSRLTWGIELPFDKDYVCYVWFDALLSYISPIFSSGNMNTQSFWPGEHLIGKDILKPHAIFWPTMLKSAGLPIYKHLNVHGYWLSRETKMSKSLGNVIDPLDTKNIYGVDVFRYFLLREMHFGSDANFSDVAIKNRLNADLANDLGNLFSRVLSMNCKYFQSILPKPYDKLPDDSILDEISSKSLTEFCKKFANVEFAQGLDALWDLVRALNKYVDSQAPWSLYKQGQMERLATVMFLLLNHMGKIAVALWPVMPQTSITLLEQLGWTDSDKKIETVNLHNLVNFDFVKPGMLVASSSNLFPRIVEDKQSNSSKLITEKKGTKCDNAHFPPINNPETETCHECSFVDISQFHSLEIRVGTVITAETVKNADKLLKLEIDFGGQTVRQIVSGISNIYTPKSLLGQQVCAIINLKPRKIKGIMSQGMILTVGDSDHLALLTPSKNMPNGSKIA